jgi:hypothetical protein
MGDAGPLQAYRACGSPGRRYRTLLIKVLCENERIERRRWMRADQGEDHAD